MTVLHSALEPHAAFPTASPDATLIGRLWRPDVAGPSVVSVRDGDVIDISAIAPTIADIANADDPVSVASHQGERIGDIDQILANSAFDARSPDKPWLLAPVDIQPVKASGVTFAVSLLERVIEEQAGGDKAAAETIRAKVSALIGDNLSAIEPGSREATRLKEHLISIGAWSQYLDVGIGPDAEIFTKAPPLAAVGTGALIGIRSDSSWNNPEPELAVLVSSTGEIVGASLANDVNLRDIEGRSALLLGQAKDNNASTAIGPFLRLLDDKFTIDDLRGLSIRLEISGRDGFSLSGVSHMELISRDLTDLVEQTLGAEHQYPDGLVLLSGTMFAPTQDRDVVGEGFTHKVGDVVRIRCPELGTLANQVDLCRSIEPWTFGIRSLIDSLSQRGLVGNRR